MSTATVHIPHDHVKAIRESLEASRQDLRRESDREAASGRLPAIEEVLEQLVAHPGSDGRSVSGPQEILWQAAYDALCTGAEAFAMECNDLWRGPFTVADARTALLRIGERLELLDSLGPPPPLPRD